MPPSIFLVRKLTRVGRPAFEARGRFGYRDPVGTSAAASGAVYEIQAQDFELSFDEVAEGLEERGLHTTDLVLIDGTWTTLAQSPPFFELAEPYARRERRLQAVKEGLQLFALIAAYLVVRVFIFGPRF